MVAMCLCICYAKWFRRTVVSQLVTVTAIRPHLTIGYLKKYIYSCRKDMNTSRHIYHLPLIPQCQQLEISWKICLFFYNLRRLINKAFSSAEVELIWFVFLFCFSQTTVHDNNKHLQSFQDQFTSNISL